MQTRAFTCPLNACIHTLTFIYMQNAHGHTRTYTHIFTHTHARSHLFRHAPAQTRPRSAHRRGARSPGPGSACPRVLGAIPVWCACMAQGGGEKEASGHCAKTVRSKKLRNCQKDMRGKPWHGQQDMRSKPRDGQQDMCGITGRRTLFGAAAAWRQCSLG